MFRSILSILGGVAIGVFTISLIEYLSHQFYQAPASLGTPAPSPPAGLENAPVPALLLILFAYALGSFFGGMVAARYASVKPVVHAVVVGVFLLVAGIANLLATAHPLWFIIASLFVYLPMAFFGGMMSSRRIP